MARDKSFYAEIACRDMKGDTSDAPLIALCLIRERCPVIADSFSPSVFARAHALAPFEHRRPAAARPVPQGRDVAVGGARAAAFD